MSPLKLLHIVLFAALFMASSAFTTPTQPLKNNRGTPLNLLPTDIPEVSSILLAKYDAKIFGYGTMKKIGAVASMMNPDVQAQILTDGSHALMDFPNLFKKPSKLQMRYAQVIGRLMIIGIGLLPHHGLHPEEMAVQLFLLGYSMKPIIRSIQLYKCVSSAQCVDECELELVELEESLP
jgi:hypothetical protein